MPARCSTTRKRTTARFSKRESPKPARWPRSSPPGSAYAAYGINTIPFFIYYSMFGFQRIGDFIWAAADMRTRGFLLGGTAGRTTLVGRRLAAPGRQQPRARAVGSESARLRSGVRLRNRRHHSGRHSPHVQRRRRHFLLHHFDERAVRHARDAERQGREGRNPQGHVQIPRGEK